jgi:PPOX class probable FMN-dependent enzyme
MTTEHSPTSTSSPPPDGCGLASQADLRTIYKPPTPGVVAKNIGHLDGHARRFVELSPFLCIGTMGRDGLGDVTPRGGEPGFVHVLDATHIALPDRPGNNRLDTLSNVVERPGVGLLFFIPGFEDTLRLSGLARITTEPALLQRFVAGGKLPLSVLVIEIKEVYLHCTKAIRRAGLWRPEAQVDRGALATAGQIFRDHMALEAEAAVIDAELEKNAREELY